VNEAYIKPATAKVVDPAFQENVKGQLGNLSSKVSRAVI